MAQIYLVRHTKVNILPGICYGATNVPLAATFPEEAQKILTQLDKIPFDHIYSSPLTRCTQLAETIAPNKYITDARLTELNFGEWEGKTWDEIYQTPYGNKWMNDYLKLSSPGGESYNDLYNRVKAFITNRSITGNTLIITHAGVIRAFLTILTNIDSKKTFDLEIKYGEIVKI